MELSQEKTQIRHIEKGFDFVGFNIRHYKTRSKKKGVVLLCKPSQDSIKSFKKQMILEFKKGQSWTSEAIINNLNPKIKGWGIYFKSGVSKRTFSNLDNWMWKRQSIFVSKRHPQKSWRWRKKKYWGKIRGRNDQWVFMDKSNNSELFLWKLAWIPIKRHVLVKGRSSPDNPELRNYWQVRQANNSKYLFKTRLMVWQKQKGKCLVCKDNIDNDEPIHMHHIIPKQHGGDNSTSNLIMLHANCHRQLHSKDGQQIIDVSKLLEPYAG